MRKAKRRTPRAPKFTISVLAMNGLVVTQRCIAGVLASKEPWELILTDNASDDGTAEYFDSLAEKDTRISVIHNKKNLGYAGPHNHALTLAKGKYFICLNNDAEVPAGWLTELEKPFKNYADCRITGAKGSCCSLQAPWPSFHGTKGSNYEYVEGSCLCIQTDFARDITLFASYLHFAYGEDLDLSLRVRARGLEIYPADFTIKHLRGFTSKNIPNIRDIQQRNHEALVKRWGSYHKFRRFDLPFIIRRAGAIGDVLLTTPLIAAIKEQNPRSEIFVETKCPEIFANNPNVKEAGKSFEQYYKWATKIYLDMSYENMPNTNIVDAYFKTACIMGDRSRVQIFPSPEDYEVAASTIKSGKWIAVHPGPTTWKGKNWPWERWVELCQLLLKTGYPPLIVGTPGPALPNFLDIRGQTSFGRLAAFIQRCDLFVGVDSFPLHVAQAMNVPVVPLFGASTPECILTGQPAFPVIGQAPCAGARHKVAGQTYVDCDGACMDSITVTQVMEAISKIL